KNREVKSLLAAHKVPDFFVEVRFTENKLSELEEVMRVHGIDAHECVMVNDSYTEILAVQKRFPGLRTLTPDALDLLGREKVA
ncbi:MAG: hypothetical protein NZT92_23220, partial [Abditibacteriales bacterium]|nr:hypothetical protein [Abditibacteriales bacterium]MDW8368503.1 hypothetical protein [Abditibacteriales bacterium]